MTDIEQVFLADIIRNPADDTPRLVYADWLEIEAGQAERAEFIRVQCELAKLRGKFDPPMLATDMSEQDRLDYLRMIDLEARERQLWSANSIGDFPTGFTPTLTFDYFGAKDSHAPVLFRRGFVAEVRCALQSWHEHGPGLCGEHPVEKVQIANREPIFSYESWGWRCSPGAFDDDVPAHIWRLMPPREQEPEGLLGGPTRHWSRWKCWDTREAARDALNAAALLWARAEAEGRRGAAQTPRGDE